MIWNRLFQGTSDCFPHLNPVVASGMKPGPPILVKYHKLKKNDISKYCLSNLSTLSMETVHDHVPTKMIPAYFKLWEKEEGQANMKTIFDDF
jgi:hypothetical protein